MPLPVERAGVLLPAFEMLLPVAPVLLDACSRLPSARPYRGRVAGAGVAANGGDALEPVAAAGGGACAAAAGSNGDGAAAAGAGADGSTAAGTDGVVASPLLIRLALAMDIVAELPPLADLAAASSSTCSTMLHLPVECAQVCSSVHAGAT